MTEWMRTKAAMALVVTCLVGAGCGPRITNLVWPPVANPTLDGIYPYDFENKGILSVRGMHNRMLTTRIEDEKLEQELLYALGRGQVDAFLWSMTLEPQAREEFLAELGTMLGVKKAGLDSFLADPGPLLEPFKLIDIKYPKSPYAGASGETRLVFRLLTHENLPDEELAVLAELAAGQRPSSPMIRAAVLLMIGQTLETVAMNDGAGRSRLLVESLDRFAGPPGLDEGESARVERVLRWTVDAVMAAGKDPDPLFIELRHVVELSNWVLTELHFPAGLPEEVSLPDMAGLDMGAADPFRYVIIDKTGTIRVATGLVFGVSATGEVGTLGEESRWAWPGKVVDNPDDIEHALREATSAVESLGPIGGAPVWDRGAALVVHPDLTIDTVVPVLDVLRSTLDHVVIVGRGSSTTGFLPMDVRPNCAMAGTRLGAILDSDSVNLENVTVGDEDDTLISDSDIESPLVLVGRVADQTKSILGKPKADVFVEVSWWEGNWTWGQVVAVYEGMLTAVTEEAQDQDVEIVVQTFLLPRWTMGETREIEIAAEEGEDVPELPEVEDTDREDLVLLGAYGDYDEKLLDAWMSAWLDGKSLGNAATVVLDVARCWGGDYRERAVEALGGGKTSILEQVATYLGDPVMGDVAESILQEAGSRAVPVLVWKMMSRDETVWMGAWRVLATLQPEHIQAGLEALLEDPDPEIRVRALQLYSNSMPAGDYTELLPLLDDPDISVQRWAMATCAMLGVHAASERLLTYVESKNTVPAIRAEALYALGLLEVTEALPYMIEAAGHSDLEVRELAALALGSVGASEDAMPALLGLLSDEEPTVVLNALRSLVNVGSEDAISYIETLLASPHPGIAAEAQMTIDKIVAANVVSIAALTGEEVEEICSTLMVDELELLAENVTPEAFDCLLDLAKSKDPDMREAAVIALGIRGDTAAIPALKKRTKDKSKAVRLAAWDALDILKKIKLKKSKKKKKKK